MAASSSAPSDSSLSFPVAEEQSSHHDTQVASPPDTISNAPAIQETVATTTANTASTATASSTNASSPTQAVLYGFDTLDDVQRYAIGALTAVFLGKRKDMNSRAFARDYMVKLFHALGLSSGQTEALLALEPEPDVVQDVIHQCVTLVGDEASRFQAIQAMLALAVVGGVYDSRARAFLNQVSLVFAVAWYKVAAVELAIAVELVRRAEEGDGIGDGKREKSAAQYLNARRRKKKKRYAAVKAGGITLAGGVLFGLTGGLIAPALLASLAGIGIAGAAGLAATGTVTSGAVVASLFGVAGAGLTGRKAKKRMGMKVSDFRFERQDDPRVLYQKQLKELKDPEWLMHRNDSAQSLEKHDVNGLVVSKSDSSARPASMENDELAAFGSDQGTSRRLSQSNSLPVVASSSGSSTNSLTNDASHAQNHTSSTMVRKEQDPLTMSLKDFDEHQNPDGLTQAPLSNPSLHMVISVPAWLESRRAGSALAQFTCVSTQLPFSQHVSLRWEARRLHEMSKAFAKFWASKATVTTIQQAYPHMVAAASTVAGAVAFAIALPLTVISCLDYIDNPWSVLVSRANGAGEQLADELTLRAYGNRPVTLVGYSLGARVIFKALESLAARNAIGIVSDVFLIGAPVTAEPARWEKVAGVVGGRLVNGYCPLDWALAYFHRGCGHGIYVAGLRRVDCRSVINMNLAFIGVGGHRFLKNAMDRALKAMGISTGKIEMTPAPLIFRGAKKEGVLEDEDALAASTKFDDAGDSSGSDSNKEEESSQGSADEDSVQDEKENGEANDNTSQKAGKGKSKKSSSWKGKSWNWPTWMTKKHSTTSKKRPRSNGVQSTAQNVSERQFNELAEGEGDASTLPDNKQSTREGQLIDFDDVAADESSPGNENGFDWELQRRLWAEQERQIEQDPTGQAALDLTLEDLAPSAVVLNVGVEITGRRLRTFIGQDEDFPTAHEEVFTNCLDEQRVLVINVYEYMPSSKTVPLSMEKYYAEQEALNREYERDEAEAAGGESPKSKGKDIKVDVYPKLLEEVRLEWPETQTKGSMRFVVKVSFTPDGDLDVKVEERGPDGEVTRNVKTFIGHEKLCTKRERKILEDREKRRLEAKKKRKKKKDDTLRITAGEQKLITHPSTNPEQPITSTNEDAVISQGFPSKEIAVNHASIDAR